jgi:hypothetical protein
MWLEELIAWLVNRRLPRPKASTADLILGHVYQSPQNAILPLARRPEHVSIIGKTGTGKTTLLEHLARQHFERPYGFVFFDFHGDVTQRLLDYAAQRDAADRVVLVDPSDPNFSPGLNLLETKGERSALTQTAEVAGILRRRWGVESFGARTEELLRNALYTLASNNLTIVELPLLLTSRHMRRRATQSLLPGEAAWYWTQRYEPLSERMQAAFREPLLNRVSALLTDPACRHFLGQRYSTFDFRRAMDEGRFVLMNLSKGRLRDNAHTLANLVFAKMQFDVLARSDIVETNRRLFTIFCDEVQNLAENDLSTILAEGRKFGVGLIAAHQYFEQLSPELRAALLAAGTHVLFRVSTSDARPLATELTASGHQRLTFELTRLSRGQAFARIGARAPVRIDVSRLRPAPRLPLKSLSAFRTGHALPRAEVDADIQKRHAELANEDFESLTNIHEFKEGQSTWA